MHIEEAKRGIVKLVALCGKLDANTSPDVEKRLLALVDEGESRIAFDFSQLTYISSLGLRVLLLVAKRVQKAGGKLAVAAVSDQIYEVFTIAGFHNIFSIYPTLDEAVTHCAC